MKSQKVVSPNQLFLQQWNRCYKASKNTDHYSGESQQLELRIQGKFCIILNHEYKHKRASQCIEKASESRSILADFDQSSFNFNKVKQSQLIFTLDLQQLKLETVQIGQSRQSMKNDHFIIISGAPICSGHSLFVPFCQEKYPQIITRKLLQATIKLTSILPNLKFGYNSQGAASSVNHFHVQIIDCMHFFESNRFSFEDEQAIQLITQGEFMNQIKVEYFYWLGGCYVRVHTNQTLLKMERHISNVIISIVEILLDKSIPHHIIFTDSHTLYIILRNFATSQHKFGWLEYSGIIIAQSAEDFQVSAETIEKQFQKLAIQDSAHLLKLIKENIQILTTKNGMIQTDMIN